MGFDTERIFASSTELVGARARIVAMANRVLSPSALKIKAGSSVDQLRLALCSRPDIQGNGGISREVYRRFIAIIIKCTPESSC